MTSKAEGVREQILGTVIKQLTGCITTLENKLHHDEITANDYENTYKFYEAAALETAMALISHDRQQLLRRVEEAIDNLQDVYSKADTAQGAVRQAKANYKQQLLDTIRKEGSK